MTRGPESRKRSINRTTKASGNGLELQGVRAISGEMTGLPPTPSSWSARKTASCVLLGLSDLIGRAAQVFDKHNAQRDSDSPEFADRKRLQTPVSGQESKSTSRSIRLSACATKAQATPSTLG